MKPCKFLGLKMLGSLGLFSGESSASGLRAESLGAWGLGACGFRGLGGFYTRSLCRKRWGSEIIRACLRSCHAPAGLKDTRKWMRFWIRAKPCGLSFGVLGLPAYPLTLNLSLLNSRHGVPKFDPEGRPQPGEVRAVLGTAPCNHHFETPRINRPPLRP